VLNLFISIIYACIYTLAAWKWGDWRNWKEYYPTILFYILGDLLYQFLFFNYSMWEFHPVLVDNDVPGQHTFTDILLACTKYPATILIFLYHFPKKRPSSILVYLLFWVGLYAFNEWISLSFGLIDHHHGWNFGWSILFNFVMFSILRVHHHRPLFALILSIIFAVLLWSALQVPLDILKQ
jgi:hypothetical protein